jgi:hypothetical protein
VYAGEVVSNAGSSCFEYRIWAHTTHPYMPICAINRPGGLVCTIGDLVHTHSDFRRHLRSLHHRMLPTNEKRRTSTRCTDLRPCPRCDRNLFRSNKSIAICSYHLDTRQHDYLDTAPVLLTGRAGQALSERARVAACTDSETNTRTASRTTTDCKNSCFDMVSAAALMISRTLC